MSTRYEVRPLGPWTDPITEPRRSAGLFRVTWDTALDHLAHEVEQLGGGLIVLQIDADPNDIRRDGMLRSKALVRFPGVRISFDSVHGPLTYATDAYEARYYSGLTSWQANVRAIGLGLEALRAVDRYGVTRRGEQYRGWTAIEASNGALTTAAAKALIASYGGLAAALKATHPDTGGTAEAFSKVQEARRVLSL